MLTLTQPLGDFIMPSASAGSSKSHANQLQAIARMPSQGI